MVMGLTLAEDLISELGVPQIVDIRDKLPVNKNYTWEQLTGGERALDALTTVGWHHDAIRKADSAQYEDLTLAARIATAHINLKSNEPNGDAGFPYHVWIRNGTPYLCNNILARTYGIASNNGYIVHVCVSGEYAGSDQLADGDRRALMAVTMQLKRDLPQYAAVKAHGELNPTSCPGYDYNAIRGDIAALEMKLKERSDRTARMTRVYNMAVRIQDLYKKAGDVNFEYRDVALQKLEDVTAFMRDKDYLNP